MDVNVTQEVLKRVDALGAKLGAVAGDTFNILLCQAHVMAWENLVFAGIFTTAAVSFGIYSRVWYKKGVVKEAANRNGDDEYCASHLALIPVIIFVILALICAFAAFEDFNNPQFWAINTLLDALRKK